jgi:hypothetical protein
MIPRGIASRVTAVSAGDEPRSEYVGAQVYALRVLGYSGRKEGNIAPQKKSHKEVAHANKTVVDSAGV